MRPGDLSCPRCFKVLDPAGAPVAGLTAGDFAVLVLANAYGATAYADVSPAGIAIAAIAGHAGYYRLAHNYPAAAGWLAVDVVPVNPLHQVVPLCWSGEVENADLDRLNANLQNPIVTLQLGGSLGQPVALSLVAHRHAVIPFAFTGVDMTPGVTYTNYRWSVRDAKDQTLAAAKYDQTTGILAADGLVTITIPETASFFSVMPEGASPADRYELRHELVADLVSASGETVSLVPSSSLTLQRREEGT